MSERAINCTYKEDIEQIVNDNQDKNIVSTLMLHLCSM